MLTREMDPAVQAQLCGLRVHDRRKQSGTFSVWCALQSIEHDIHIRISHKDFKGPPVRGPLIKVDVSLFSLMYASILLKKAK